MKKFMHFATIVLFLLPFQAMAALYGTILGSTSTLVELDPVTGSVISTIGDIGYRVNGMTYDTTTDTMYATTSQGDAIFPSGLITINLTSGAGTTIGVVTGLRTNLSAINSSGVLYGWVEGSDDLGLWDKDAGTVTIVGESGLSTAEQSLSFDDSDTLYYVSLCCEGIQIINTTTGAATPGPEISGATGNTLHHGDFAPGTSLLYAITQTDEYQDPRSIDILDVTTGTVTSTITAPDNLHTLAFTSTIMPSANVPVPALSTYGLLLLMLVLLAVTGRRLLTSFKRS